MAKRTQKLMSTVGWLALIGAGFYIFSMRVASQFIVGNVRATGFRLQELFSTGMLRGKLIIPIDNRSPISAPIERFEGVILYRNYLPLANVVIADPVVLRAGESTDMIVDVNVGLGTLTDSVVRAIQDNAYFPSFYIKGKAYTSGVVIPINQNIQII